MTLNNVALHTNALLIVVVIFLILIFLVLLVVIIIVIICLGFSSGACRSTRPSLCRPASGTVRSNVLPTRHTQSNTNQRLTFKFHRRPSPHLLVFLTQLHGLLIEGRAVFGALFRPQLAQFLGDLSNGQPGILTLHCRPELRAKQKEGRPVENKEDFHHHQTFHPVSKLTSTDILQRINLRGSFRGIGVLLLPAHLADAFGWHVIFHLPVIANFIRFGHVIKPGFL